MPAQFVSANAHCQPRALVAAGLAVAALCPRALPQPGTAARDTVQTELEALLQDSDPTLRGEAALALATTKDPRYHTRIRAIAKDRREAARLRGLVALGVLGAPGAETLLGDVLLRPGRETPDRSAAALGLGLLPDSFPAPAIERYLNRVDGGSYRKHHDTLTSLLVGFSIAPHPSRAPSLVALLEDDANRDPDVHRLALRALAHVPGGLPDTDLAEWLTSRHESARLGMLEALLSAQRDLTPDELSKIEVAAVKDRSPRVRAAALRVLTQQRKLSSLQLGMVALRSTHTEEAAAGVENARRLGGGTIRVAMESQILHTTRPDLQAAMLRAYDASSNEEFIDGCLRLAEDRRSAESVRVHAAALAARSGERKSRAALRRLFVEAEDAANLRVLARAILALDPSLIGSDRVFPAATSTDLRLLPVRMEALLSAGYPGAGALLREALTSDDLRANTKALLVRALRMALLRDEDARLLAALPPSVQAAVE